MSANCFPSWATTTTLYQPGGAPRLPFVTRLYTPWSSKVPEGSNGLVFFFDVSGLNTTIAVAAFNDWSLIVILPVTGKTGPTPGSAPQPARGSRSNDATAFCKEARIMGVTPSQPEKSG